jgi:hypothetical protein
MFRPALLIVAIVLTNPHDALAQQADVPACTSRFDFRLQSEGPWPVFATTRAGQTCVGGRQWWSGSGTTVFKRLYVATFPKQGTVRLEEGARFYYTPKKGFVGSDRFTLKLCGTISEKPHCTFLDVRVDVTPPA